MYCISHRLISDFYVANIKQTTLYVNHILTLSPLATALSTAAAKAVVFPNINKH